MGSVPFLDVGSLIQARPFRKENGTFERAIGEIKAGRKSSCWMWFVIPSPPHMKNNVEHGSSMNRKQPDGWEQLNAKSR